LEKSGPLVLFDIIFLCDSKLILFATKGAVVGVRVKDVAVPGATLISINSNQKVVDLGELLRKEHIHAVPVWNGQKFEGCVDTTDLITWAILKFPKVKNFFSFLFFSLD
jgi:predicted transcriptional regulator